MRAFVHQQLPGRVVFGVGTFSSLPTEVDLLPGQRILLIADSAAKDRADFAADILAARAVSRIEDVRQHVPEEDVVEARGVAQEAGIDAIVTIGGGSATGLAKAVALELEVPIVAVPTTYAGSELTPIYGITSNGRKRTGRDRRVLPRTVIYDPVLTTSLSSDVTSSSGLNALAHCVEALYDSEASPIVTLLAEEAIRSLVRGIPAAVYDPADLEGRSDALYGAYLAGAALAVARMALHHTVSHVLGGTFGLPHGPINAALLPHVVQFNAPAAADAVERVASALGATRAPEAIFEFAERIGAPTSLRAIGMREDQLSEAARISAESVKWNPRSVTAADILAILCSAFHGHRPGLSG